MHTSVGCHRCHCAPHTDSPAPWTGVLLCCPSLLLSHSHPSLYHHPLTHIPALSLTARLLDPRHRQISTGGKSQGMMELVSTVVKKEGVAKLWKGNSAAVVRVVPYLSMQFL